MPSKNKKFIQSLGKRVKYVDNLVNNAGVANKDYFITVEDNEIVYPKGMHW